MYDILRVLSKPDDWEAKEQLSAPSIYKGYLVSTDA
jgi:hypothetical protein